MGAAWPSDLGLIQFLKSGDPGFRYHFEHQLLFLVVPGLTPGRRFYISPCQLGFFIFSVYVG